MLLSKRSQNELILILAIESSQVHGSLTLYSSAKKPLVVYVSHAEIENKTGKSEDLIKSAVKGVYKVIDDANLYFAKNNKLTNLPRISTIHYILSSPWVMPETNNLKFTFNKDTVVTNKFIQKSINDVESNQTAISQESLETIERKILDISLNGYSVTNWENRSAKTLEISFVTSFCGTQTVKLFRETAQKIVPDSRIYFHSTRLAQHFGWNHLLADFHNYSLIHIHGSLTDILFVRNRKCVLFGSFPFGSETVRLTP